ncbi:LacI family transcriptional regulator [Thiotrichales bacterium 19S3-7]|nr:LacI family transcriptional regulator [Thiotrichales bacterium 19S3-7]MCF6800655.1 LacI family transcriptional regulator [Thiotrichales bacterium 19S3-11]
MKKPISIREVAEASGVSISTVSRVLNPNQKVKISDSVSFRVKATAEKLGYISNLTAASLRMQKTQAIGMVVPDLLNPLFPSIIKGVQDVLSKNGYVLLTVCSNNDVQNATSEVFNLLSRRVDGIIMASAFLEDESISYCTKQNIPMVVVNRTINDGHLVHQILNDDALGINLAVEYLFKLGYQSLVHIAGPQNISQGKIRLQQFKSSCMRLNLDYQIIEAEEFTIDSGKKAAKAILFHSQQPLGIIAANDLIAIGAIDTLKAIGHRIREDFSIIGYNNTLLTDRLDPPLTTISISHLKMGEAAAELLLSEIESPAKIKRKVLLPPKLEIRQSTKFI